MLFVQECAFENIFWKMLDILSQPQCVISSGAGPVYKQAMNLVITEPTDGLAPLAAGNVLTGLVQDCNNSSALAKEFLQSCIKPFNTVFLLVLSQSTLCFFHELAQINWNRSMVK